MYNLTAAFPASKRVVPDDGLVILPRTHNNLLRGLPQPALGPRGRHLSRFEPARIVLEALGVLKLTEVTSGRSLEVFGFGIETSCATCFAARVLLLAYNSRIHGTDRWLQTGTL